MNKIKNILIVVLFSAIGLMFLFGGKKAGKFEADIAYMKGQNAMLEQKIIEKDSLIASENCRIDSLKKVNDSLQLQAGKLSAEKQKAIKQRDEALAQLQTISTDSSYLFLQSVAYNFPGTLRYLFNELQVRGIHSDFIKLQTSEKIIYTLEKQANNCGLRVKNLEDISAGFENNILLKDANIADYKSIIENDSLMISDLDKTARKERNRKNFWRSTTGITVLILLGSIL